MYIFLNIVFILDFCFNLKVPKEIYGDGAVAAICLGPTLALMLLGYLIYKGITNRIRKNRIEEKHKPSGEYNFFDWD
jgi:hypothetical protein